MYKKTFLKYYFVHCSTKNLVQKCTFFLTKENFERVSHKKHTKWQTHVSLSHFSGMNSPLALEINFTHKTAWISLRNELKVFWKTTTSTKDASLFCLLDISLKDKLQEIHHRRLKSIYYKATSVSITFCSVLKARSFQCPFIYINLVIYVTDTYIHTSVHKFLDYHKGR